MGADKLSNKEAAKLGKNLRDAKDGNMIVGSFAAELVGESYPFSKAMSDITFGAFTDEDLGRRFAQWCDTSR